MAGVGAAQTTADPETKKNSGKVLIFGGGG